MKTLFVSYCQRDLPVIAPLLQDLKDQLGSCHTASLSLWRDSDIVCGTPWDRSIRDALRECELGLLFVSPAFGCSSYIKSVEIPELRSRCLPVGARPVCFQTQLHPALSALQVYRLPASGNRRLFYSECDTPRRREAFASGLYQQILARLAVPAVL